MAEIQDNTNSLEDLNDILKARREKLAKLCEMDKNPYHSVRFDINTYSTYVLTEFEKYEGQNISIAGRLMSKRIMGKAGFAHIQDSKGQIQIYARSNELGEENYTEFTSFDIGDIIGVKGIVFKTNKGEISVKAIELSLLAKALQPLPEKWHGLRDMDLRYRHRHLDLIMNTDVKRKFELRSKIISHIRRYLDDLGYLEVETPVLQGTPGGAAAKPFITHHNTLDIGMYLRIATELHLKRLIIGGFDKVYELGRIFRNEGMSVKHNPEFTTVEIYKAYADYTDIMDLVEDLIVKVSESVLGTCFLEYQGEKLDLSRGWTRMTMIEAVFKYTGVDFSCITTDEDAREAAKKAGVTVKAGTSWGNTLNEVFEQTVESNLKQPTFIMDYPVSVSPLAKKIPKDSRLTYRFELFIMGREIANAFSELNDPIDQKERFIEQSRQRQAGDEEAHMMDEEFVYALEAGMPPTGGIGIGIDRLVMLLTNAYSIKDVILFPTMKPLVRN